MIKFKQVHPYKPLVPIWIDPDADKPIEVGFKHTSNGMRLIDIHSGRELACIKQFSMQQQAHNYATLEVEFILGPEIVYTTDKGNQDG